MALRIIALTFMKSTFTITNVLRAVTYQLGLAIDDIAHTDRQFIVYVKASHLAWHVILSGILIKSKNRLNAATRDEIIKNDNPDVTLQLIPGVLVILGKKINDTYYWTNEERPLTIY